jgi:hypothetical protein
MGHGFGKHALREIDRAPHVPNHGFVNAHSFAKVMCATQLPLQNI